jgi:1-acyl-sn-glycerol-3-phosphate acyltransferase
MDPRKTNIKSGVGMIEYHAKVPVVPVLLETSNWKILPFRRTYVRIGKPISYEEFNFTESSGKQFSEASQLIFKRITEQIGGNG